MRRERAGWVPWYLAGLFLAALTVAGCAPGGLSPNEEDLVGPWRDAQGQLVPDGTGESDGLLVLAASSGSTTCSQENVTVFLRLAWPPGRRLDLQKSTDSDDLSEYVRRTEGSGMKTDGRSDPDTTLPAAARSTGLNNDGNLLHADPSDARAIWLRRPDQRVERWARLGPDEGCA